MGSASSSWRSTRSWAGRWRLKVPRGEVLLDPESRERFVREARAVAGLDHPNIVPLYEAGEVGPVCYLASAYCEGPTLAAWLRRSPGACPAPPGRADPRLAGRRHAPCPRAWHPPSRSEALECPAPSPWPAIGSRPGNATDHHEPASRRSHPKRADEPEFVARIIDFGLARLMDRATEEATASFAAMGSAPYMAPEQVEGKKVGPATDVYGLGAILYSMLCGRPPHRGNQRPGHLTPGRGR